MKKCFPGKSTALPTEDILKVLNYAGKKNRQF